MSATIQLQPLLKAATKAALLAADYIAGFDRAQLNVGHKTAGESYSSQVVTQVDKQCEQIIKEQLQPSGKQFDLALLSEESACEQECSTHPRLQKEHFWCIDPLDGTLPFIEGGDGFAVAIALVSRSGNPVLGVIYRPGNHTLYQAMLNPDSTPRLWRNQQLWQPQLQRRETKVKACFDRSFSAQPHFSSVLRQLEKVCIELGYTGLEWCDDAGAVVNACSVLERAPSCYFKFPKPGKGGGSLWDFSATAVLLQAAGGWVSDIHGNPLDLNRPDSNFMNHNGVLFASDAVLAKGIIALYRTLQLKD